jgi:pyrimidine operon attenuation protein / uracil phosphoribosyltransferase
MEKKYILDKETTLLKLKRLAYEITERNYTEQQLFFAGIRESGYTVARLLAKEVMEISNIHVELVEIMMDKRYPVEVMLDREIGFNNQSIVIIDDVANSGKAMLYALKPFLSFQPKQIQTLVLVERTHKTFPVQPDYVGLSIATTLEEHIYVELKGDEITGAYLL